MGDRGQVAVSANVPFVSRNLPLVVDDTIAALASPPGPAARGIVRVSGPNVFSVVDSCFTAQPSADWQPARVARRYPGQMTLQDVAAPLPVDLYLWPTRRSYTAQPLAELHTIGSPPLLEAVLSTLCSHGARPARAGEFTLRAFLAGRIDLMQAEAVLGVIDAADHRELELALRQLAGGVSGRLAEIRSDLLGLLGDLEAGLDFVEEDIEFVTRDQLLQRLDRCRRNLDELLGQADDRMASTGRARVVLAGLPNAGKSTLFNALTGSDAALVSPREGTTRDFLNAEINCCGVAIELIDTAGREESKSGIDRLAQSAGDHQLEQADLVIWCVAADLTEDRRDENDRRLAVALEACPRVLIARTRSDLVDGDRGIDADVATSVVTGSGTSALRNLIAGRLSSDESGQRQLLGSTAARCRDSLTGAIAALRRAEQSAVDGMGDEITSLEIRDALNHIGVIMGEVYTDDILDHIFSNFCIGK